MTTIKKRCNFDSNFVQNVYLYHTLQYILVKLSVEFKSLKKDNSRFEKEAKINDNTKTVEKVSKHCEGTKQLSDLNLSVPAGVCGQQRSVVRVAVR